MLRRPDKNGTMSSVVIWSTSASLETPNAAVARSNKLWHLVVACRPTTRAFADPFPSSDVDVLGESLRSMSIL